MAAEIDVAVLIVGGGGAGLTASMLLSQLGVETWLVSVLPTTSTLPKAHVLNQRAMEILADVGVADEIYARGTPLAHMRCTGWYAGLAGPRPEHGRCIARQEAWGAGYTDTDWVAASPFASANLPQIRLEPILKARAEALAPGRVRFHHELLTVEQDGDGVRALVVDRDRGEAYRVNARYLLACDGGRTVGRLLGVEMEGQRGLANEISVHMSADLSPWARDPEVLIRWLWIPETGALAVLVPMGPDRWGPESEEWVFHLNYADGDLRGVDDAQVEADMRRALGIGDHPLTIHRISRWSLEGVVAARFQVGRIFLVGDAAHRHPPTGGLGLNSAIHDAHNLCWKVAAVLRGEASAGLLATYEAERRPVDARNVQRSLENAFNHFAIGEALGVQPGAPADANWEAVRRLWSEGPEGAAQRRRVRRAVASQSMEFREHDVEYGYRYASTAVVPDGSAVPPSPDPIRVYAPCTRPGHPLPHAWVEDDDGTRVALMQLVRPGRFLLIAGEEGEAWCRAARAIARDGDLALDAVTVGHLDGDYLDLRCQWLQQREIGAEGAILVRPDRCIAWRALGAAADARATLGAALEQILARRPPD
ncbi:MAG TPA: FAD-dependent monooxygenase [Candidatus Dormibacteraeota bacterium]|nr:FAD-dependent monooxygenase [Candidatus Dormibacteraeota bacterium]